MSLFNTIFSIYIIISVVLFLIALATLWYYKKSRLLKKTAAIISENNSNIEVKETIQTATLEHSKLIASVFIRITNLYSNIINELSKQDNQMLQNNKNEAKKLQKDVELLKDELFLYLQTKTDSKVVTKFYILTIENMEDMVVEMEQILKISKGYVFKNQKKLTFNQIRDLKSLDTESSRLFEKINSIISNNNFDAFGSLSKDANSLISKIDLMLENHIIRLNNTNNNPKNFKIYTKLLRKSSVLFKHLVIIVNRYKEVYENKAN